LRPPPGRRWQRKLDRAELAAHFHAVSLARVQIFNVAAGLIELLGKAR